MSRQPATKANMFTKAYAKETQRGLIIFSISARLFLVLLSYTKMCPAAARLHREDWLSEIWRALKLARCSHRSPAGCNAVPSSICKYAPTSQHIRICVCRYRESRFSVNNCTLVVSWLNDQTSLQFTHVYIAAPWVWSRKLPGSCLSSMYVMDGWKLVLSVVEPLCSKLGLFRLAWAQHS